MCGCFKNSRNRWSSRPRRVRSWVSLPARQPVLDAVAENAARLCNSSDALIYRIDGENLRLSAHFGPLEWITESLPLSRETVTGRSIVDAQTVHVHDLAAAPETEFPLGKMLQRRL